ncbi:MULTISPECIES: [NiFe]-hydrogenase assembly chaperone HybE [Pseudomonas]|uniref:[NiFe]-hydrogenase assembly chaperone HybE n=1 Tax=Pseudomonas nitroreducens TaxID=46680 RepID=UPI001E41C767|nr:MULTISPECIES: [NiFe]-hydrogenase assembly chaperone HybE [Pseudomonas]MCE4070806.1 [NiFe]-hydrogenase assembly chaperone HybE [Pseudomonas nitritireducens]MCE4080324.1 [NiFe]-hydrogenase assembly chaperone HybE [Pseudomonas nitroreducens]
MSDPLARAEALAQRFRDIADSRMHGLPLLNPALDVEAIGFAPQHLDTADSGGLLGVLITPWCMNLVWLPDAPLNAAANGAIREHALGGERLSFIAAQDELFGHYQSCSLFSPMFDFIDQQQARDTARQVLALLRRRPPEQPANPSRRSLFGRLAGTTR